MRRVRSKRNLLASCDGEEWLGGIGRQGKEGDLVPVTNQGVYDEVCRSVLGERRARLKISAANLFVLSYIS
jgi:hypothetical protein